MLRYLFITPLFAYMLLSQFIMATTYVPIPIDDMMIVIKLEDNKIVLKKTGQTISYYAGDDGSYKKGLVPSYSRANEVVTDNVTGLQWQDNVEIQDTYMNWYDAKKYCTDLLLDGGEWRLPIRRELVGLINYGRMFPSVNPIFVNITSNGFWSITSNVSYAKTAWSVFFDIGNQSFDGKLSDNRVICVREGFVK